MSDILLIVGMILATYPTRWVLFGFAQSLTFPKWFTTALTFVPITVLPALFIPIVVQPHGNLWLNLNNPYLVSATLAAIIAWKWRNILLTITLGLSIFALLKLWL